MKKIGFKNIKKIIIFTILIIGIILISPIINKEVYAKTGKLPANLNIGKFTGTVDAITKVLNTAEQYYTQTDEYKQNDIYIKNNGYNVSSMLMEGDEFWTAKGSNLQQFDPNFQQAKAMPTGTGQNKLQPRAGLQKYSAQDLTVDNDILCGFQAVLIQQDAQSKEDLSNIFKIPADSELIKRLEHFINTRSNALKNANTLEGAYGLDKNKGYTYLDEYNVAPYPGESISIAQMKKRFDYDYSGSKNPTYPYTIKGVDLPFEEEFKNKVVKVSNNHQALFDIKNSNQFRKYAQARDLTQQAYDSAVNGAIDKELDKYDAAKIWTEVNESNSQADTSGLIRTNTYFEFSGEKDDVSPQLAFAHAVAQVKTTPGVGYPGAAQEILWIIAGREYSDPRSSNIDVMAVNTKHAETPGLLSLSGAFESHHKRLVQWRSKNAGKYTPEFKVDDKPRDRIFNSKSEKYKGGSWLVGPYKMDYLLSKVKFNGNDLYFAGLEKMTVYGEYTDSKKNENSIKEIKKWSFFVPLKTSEKGLTQSEIDKGIETSSLKYGVPEPNQTFYIEIPYDENLLRIKELKAKFKALDYDASAEQYLGMGEYVDFKLDVAVEKFEEITNKYRKVEIESIKVEPILKNGLVMDKAILKVTFKNPVYLSSQGYTTPFYEMAEGMDIDLDKWKVVAGSGGKTLFKHVNREDLNNEAAISFPGGIYYKYGHLAEGTSIKGGIYDQVSFADFYSGSAAIPATEYINVPPKITHTESGRGDHSSTVTITVNEGMGVLFDDETTYENSKTYKKDYLNYKSKTATYRTYSGDIRTITIPAPPIPDLTVSQHYIGEQKYKLKSNIKSTFTYTDPETKQFVSLLRWEYLFPRRSEPYNVVVTSYFKDYDKKIITIPKISGNSGNMNNINKFDNIKLGKNNIEDIINNKNIEIIKEQGRRKEYGNNFVNRIPYETNFSEDYTYILHKLPDALIVPKAKLEKTTSQPQIRITGELFYDEVEIKLTEDGKIPPPPTSDEPDPTPGFLLPIGGKVWEDTLYGDKLPSYNFILQSQDDDVLKDEVVVRVNRLIIRESDKKIIEKQAARVFRKGEYTKPIERNSIITNKKGEWGKYYLRDLGFTQEELNVKKYSNKTHKVKFEVEFEYNGLEYIPVPPLASLEYKASNLNLKTEDKAINDSVAVENVAKRDEINREVGEVNGSVQMNKDRQTTGVAIGVNNVSANDMALNYSGKHNPDINRTVSTLDTKTTKKNMIASTLNTGILYPLGDVYLIDTKQAMKNQSAATPGNAAYDMVVVMDNTKLDEFKDKKGNPKEGVSIKPALDNKSVVNFHESNTHMENINLGLLKRKPVDLELESDLMLSIQFVNKKPLLKTFSNKYDLDNDPKDPYRYLISKYSKNYDDIQYKLDIYKADYIYKTVMYKDPDLSEALTKEAERLEKENNDKSGRNLDIYLQYKQAITNYSQNDNVILSGVDIYYNNSLTPVLDKEITKEVDQEEIKNGKVTGHVKISGNNVIIGTPEYKIVNINELFTRKYFEETKFKENEYTDIPLSGSYKWENVTNDKSKTVQKLTSLHKKQPNGFGGNKEGVLIPSLRRLEILTNFKINNDELFKEDGIVVSNAIRRGNKHHLSEISGYATYNKYTGKVTGKVDRDSAPANINLSLLKFTEDGFKNNEKQEFQYLEDDTATSPVIGVELEKETPRKVSGMIWEDKRNRQVARVNMGDGIFDAKAGELPISNKVVNLEERISIKAKDLGLKYKMKNDLDNKVLKNEHYYVDIPYVWDNVIDVKDKQGKTIINIPDLRKLTGFQSYVRTNKDGNYQFNGTPAGNFVVKLPYISIGNEITEKLGINLAKDQIETTEIVDAANRSKATNVYNGQDFKVSVYNGGDINTVNQTWLPIAPKENHSYGRDNEYQRFKIYKNSEKINGYNGNILEVLNMSQEELNKKGNENYKKVLSEIANMTAETPIMSLGVDYYDKQNSEEVLYGKFKDVFALAGTTITKDGKGNVNKPEGFRGYSNVNIALEERPKTKLVLDKQITRLTLKNSDGTKIVDAKYNTTYDIDNIVMPAVDKVILNKGSDDSTPTKNGYTTGEYILKVKTEVDKESLNGDKVTPLNTSVYATTKPYWEEKKKDDDLYTNARGWENVHKKDPVSRVSNGYIHLNFDKQLLSDTNIEIEYQVQLYNLGEVDRATIQPNFKNIDLKTAEKDNIVSKHVGITPQNNETYSKLNHELDKSNYGFGRFFGPGYYTGIYNEDKTASIGNYKVYKEKVSKSYANKIIDYIDNSAVKDELQNDNWVQVKKPEEINKIVAAYDDKGKKVFDFKAENMKDSDGKSYFTADGSNIYINEKMNKGLIPYYEYVTAIKRGVDKAKIDPYNLSSTIGIKRLASQQADEDLSFDNIVEIIEYSTDAGRRSPSSTPGNVNTRISETFNAIGLEPDTGLALLVTITPPTGLSQASRTTYSTLNIMLVIMVGVALTAIVVKIIIDSRSKDKILPNEIPNEINDINYKK